MKTRHFAILFFAVVAVASGCSKSKSEDAPRVDVVHPNQQPPPSAPRACEVQYLQSFAPNVPERIETVQISRVVQRTIRRDCSRRIISDRIETVQQPKAEMPFLATQSTQGLRTRIEVINRQTCDTTSGHSSRANPNDRFVVLTTARAFFGQDLYVDRDQENYLDYTVYACDRRNCMPMRIFEQGTIRVRIDYSEERLPDREIYPRNCRRSGGRRY